MRRRREKKKIYIYIYIQKKERETTGAEERVKQKMRENWNKILFFINFVVTVSCHF